MRVRKKENELIISSCGDMHAAPYNEGLDYSDITDEECDNFEYTSTVFAEDMVQPLDEEITLELETHKPPNEKMESYVYRSGKTDLVEHCIDTGDSLPIRAPFYPVPRAYLGQDPVFQ